jgi:crossover junction endodeoxyribonuclease RuvC
MFEGRVLGVDPGTSAIGLAVVEARPKLSVLWSQTLRTPPGLDVAERLRRIHWGVREAIRRDHPESLAVERLMWGRNAGSAMAVARASGVIMLAAAEEGVPVEEYAPLEVKMAVTGVGNAPKDAVRRSLSRVLGIHGVPDGPDATDAVAVAVCHLHQARMRRRAREVAR